MKIALGSIASGETFTFALGEVTNPSKIGASALFKVRTLFDSGVVDFNEAFGFVAFSSTPCKQQLSKNPPACYKPPPSIFNKIAPSCRPNSEHNLPNGLLGE